MAGKTVTKKPTPSVSKIDQFIDRQLKKTSARVRWLDGLSLLFGFFLLLFGYVTAILVLESFVELSAVARIVSLSVFAVGMLAFLILAVVPFLRTRVNPYYSAIRLEETIPEGKDSLINWLDVKESDIPPAFRQAMGVRAATDLKKADPEEASQNSSPLWLGAALGVLALTLIVVFLCSPSRFSSKLLRAFSPLQTNPLISPVRVAFITPKEDRHYVLLNRPVQVHVQISGDVREAGSRGAPVLEYRSTTNGKYVAKPLEQVDRLDWVATLSGAEIQHGAYYRITAGNYSTKERQIIARAAPQVLEYAITAIYPEYAKKQQPKEPIRFRPNDTASDDAKKTPLSFLQGTKVTFRAITNRELQKSYLELKQGESTEKQFGQSPQKESHIAQFAPIELREPGHFRVGFTPAHGPDYLEAKPHAFLILQDQKPTAEWLAPTEKTIKRPANGTVVLSALVKDDYGVRSIRLRMKVTPVSGESLELNPNPYVTATKENTRDFSFGTEVPYEDLLELEKLHELHPKMKPLQAKTKIEYWLEARDNCSYPEGNHGNLGKSEVQTIIITEDSASKEEQEKIRQQAKKQCDENVSQLEQKRQDNAFEKSLKELLDPKGSEDNKNNKNNNEKSKDGEGKDEKKKENDSGMGKNKDEKKENDPDMGKGKGKDEKKKENDSGMGKGKDEKKKENDSGMGKDKDQKKENDMGKGKGKDEKNMGEKDGKQPNDGKDPGMNQDNNPKPDKGGNQQPPSQGKGEGKPSNSPPGQSKGPGDGPPNGSGSDNIQKDGPKKQPNQKLPQIVRTKPGNPNPDLPSQTKGPDNKPGPGQTSDGNKPGNKGKGSNSDPGNGQNNGKGKLKPGNGPITDGQPNGQKADVTSADGQKANEEYLKSLNVLQLEELNAFKDKLRNSDFSKEKQQRLMNQAINRLKQGKKLSLLPPGKGNTYLPNQGPQELSTNKDDPSGTVAASEGVEPTEYLQPFRQVLQLPKKNP